MSSLAHPVHLDHTHVGTAEEETKRDRKTVSICTIGKQVILQKFMHASPVSTPPTHTHTHTHLLRDSGEGTPSSNRLVRYLTNIHISIYGQSVGGASCRRGIVTGVIVAACWTAHLMVVGGHVVGHVLHSTMGHDSSRSQV